MGKSSNSIEKNSIEKNVQTVSPIENEGNSGREKGFCLKTVKFLFSHIGLCGMVCAYSVAGGFIFRHLEQTNEKEECMKAMHSYYPMQDSTVYKMWEIAKSYAHVVENYDSEFLATADIKHQLELFQKSVTELGYSGENCTLMGEEDGPAYKWSFAGALLFSVTVITTIGYGNIAPKTYWGRLVCIAYALLGIPLMLLCLANIGDVMADIFRYVYSNICCCGCCRRRERVSVSNATTPDLNTPEAWKAQYNSGGGPVIIDDYEDDEYIDEKISVPLTVTLGVIAAYIFMGAILFGNWEGWEALDASYFCFVTISTIGFGDMVPGTSAMESGFKDTKDQVKMILSAIYMLLGLALLSMCFSLIQEEIATKFKWIGEKLGLINKDADNIEENEENDEVIS